jgi:hypothetical protein
VNLDLLGPAELDNFVVESHPVVPFERVIEMQRSSMVGVSSKPYNLFFAFLTRGTPFFHTAAQRHE